MARRIAQEKNRDLNEVKWSWKKSGIQQLQQFLTEPYDPTLPSPKLSDLYDTTSASYERKKLRLQGINPVTKRKLSDGGGREQKGPTCYIYAMIREPLRAAGLDTGPLDSVLKSIPDTNEVTDHVRKQFDTLQGYADADQAAKIGGRAYLRAVLQTTRISQHCLNSAAAISAGIGLESLFDRKQTQAAEDAVTTFVQKRGGKTNNSRQRARQLLAELEQRKQAENSSLHKIVNKITTGSSNPAYETMLKDVARRSDTAKLEFQKQQTKQPDRELEAGETLLKSLVSRAPTLFDMEKTLDVPDSDTMDDQVRWFVQTLTSLGGAAVLGTNRWSSNRDAVPDLSYTTGTTHESMHAIFISGIKQVADNDWVVCVRDPNMDDNTVVEVPIRTFLKLHCPDTPTWEPKLLVKLLGLFRRRTQKRLSKPQMSDLFVNRVTRTE